MLALESTFRRNANGLVGNPADPPMMSVRIMTIVWQHFPDGGLALLTMLALADFGNDQGKSIHPSVPTLGKKIRHNDRYTRKILRSLEADGWIETISETVGGSRTSTRRYRINTRKLKSTPVLQDTPKQHLTPVLQDRDPCPPGHPTH
jgi:hypothetical protein